MKTKTIILIAIFLCLTGSVSAAEYYVKPDGNDGLDGKSDATAWKRISKVNSHDFQTGENVFFKCGGTWSSPLNIDWGGTADNRVVVGAYYGDGTIGVSGDKPVFDGGTHSTTILPEEPSGGTNYGLVYVGYRDYVTIENIRTQDSRGIGIKIAYSDYAIVNSCECDWIRSSGIQVMRSNHAQVTGCVAHNVGIGHKYFGETNWGFGMGGVLNVTNLTIKDNLVYECWTEGIGLYRYVDNCVVENNLIYDAQKYGIYLDAAKGNIIRNNIVYGTTNPLFHRGGNRVGAGLGVTDELAIPARSENNEFYGNLVANCAKGMGIGANNHSFKNSVVANNIFVDNNINICVYAYPSGTYENSIVKNNISWKISDDCAHYDGPDTHSGLVFNYNLWSSAPSTGGQGPNDPIYAVPLLMKTSGWRSLAGGELTGQEFTLQSTSPAIDKGTNLGNPYNSGLDPASTWPNSVSTLDQNSYGTNWEIGAYVFTGGIPITGDLNQDGQVNILDIQTCVNVFLEIETNPGIVLRADVNNDGSVNVLDVQTIVNIILG